MENMTVAMLQDSLYTVDPRAAAKTAVAKAMNDYENEVYFEDWGASPQLTDAAHKAEDTAPALTRNGTDGRVYGGDCNLIHAPDGRRVEFGQRMAHLLDLTMRANAENRTASEKANQLLCPGCYMVVIFNMATELARANHQPLNELAKSMANAFHRLAEEGTDAIEHITVFLDGGEA